jgi:Na+-transporting methylmalonyl-CoA/oxaloacetate decarboxylase beta subunit
LAGTFGALQLVSVIASWKSGQGKTVSRFNRLGIFPVILWAAALSLALVSLSTPVLGLLGIQEMGKSFGVVTLLSMTSWGLWIMFAALLINASIVGE